MRIRGVAAYGDIKKRELLDRTAVMVDALRTSATIITAVHNGCDRIVPADEPNEAAAIRRISEGNVILCGEADARRISGFDLGNSPHEYTREAVRGQVVLYATSNGSAAVRYLSSADHVLVGTFLNATAVARKAHELGKDVVLVCAGLNGEFSTDDIIAMGCILERLTEMDASIETDDLCKVAMKMYREAAGDILGALEGCTSYEHLKSLHYDEDLEYCIQEDVFEEVPEYAEGVIQ